MKKLMLATALFVSSFTAQADTPTHFDLCMQIHDAAHVTMQLRQMGDSHYEMSKLAQGETTQRIINDAFQVRVFGSDFLKMQAADRFAEEYFDRCVDGEF